MSYNIAEINSGFVSLTAAGVAEGTNANTFKTTNTLTFTNNGKQIQWAPIADLRNEAVFSNHLAAQVRGAPT